ncbi:IS66 family transposase [Arachidicoccus soli]|uniref:IS66 family transposase n=1 Tax=Arachidicoccus soli TaxID=2341117 RepID=A0A386HSZ3_9BACT|nr:IS66 family transposase [Arachidicoccus soli]
MEATLQNYSKEELIALIQEQKNKAPLFEKEKATLEKKNAFLEKQNSFLENKRIALEVEKATLESEAVYLKYQIEQLKRLAFGQKRERFENPDNGQLSLPFEMEPEIKQEIEAVTTEKITYVRQKAKSNHSGRQPLPEHLAVEEIEIYPEGDLSAMTCIGKEVTDELECQPARYYIKRYIRYKYAPKNKEGVLIGQLPSRIIEKGIAGPGLLASILVDKYVDHLPLYRQIQRFKREKIPIASSTIEGWTRQSLDVVNILYQHLLRETKSKGYLQADETPIKVLDKNKKDSCHQGYYWVYHNPIDKTVLFDYQPGRSTQAATQVLEGFKGYLQTDGYAAYDTIGKSEDITHLNCWAHARREFEKALSNDKARAEIALLFIQSLYSVEREAREKTMDVTQRKKLRLDKSLPTLNAFAKWMTTEVKTGNILPKSPIGKAFFYSINRWDKLSAYLYDGMLEIDNNLVENALRPIALGRKNYLFAGSHDAAQRAACIYSFFAICKKHEVNPYQWLKYVFENIMDTKTSQLHKLYPQNFIELNKM